MNWDAIGAIAELLGSMAFFATLVCFIIQVRHSAKALEQQNQFPVAQIMQARTETFMQCVNKLPDSEEHLTRFSSRRGYRYDDDYRNHRRMREENTRISGSI